MQHSEIRENLITALSTWQMFIVDIKRNNMAFDIIADNCDLHFKKPKLNININTAV